MFNGKNSIALSGWKCDLVFINKMKELISKYEGKELINQVQAMCGASERTAYENVQAVKELTHIENTIANIRNGKIYGSENSRRLEFLNFRLIA